MKRPDRRFLPAAVMAAAVVLLAGCAGQEQSGTPAHRISTWVSGTGAGSAIGTLEIDTRHIDQALARHDPVGVVRTICAVLASDGRTAYGTLPTPDSALTNDLAAAYQDAYLAGSTCYSAGNNASLLRKSANERAAVVAKLATAIERISSVTGQVPSTTTTTLPPGSTGDPFAG